MPSTIKVKKTPDQDVRSLRSWIIETVVSFLIVALVCVSVTLVDVFVRHISFVNETMRVLGDGFGAGGLICFSLWMLIWLSGEGAFDIIVYGVRKVFNVTFQNLMKNSALPDSYYDYVAMKRAKKRNHFFPFGLSSFICFIVGLILSFLCI